MLYTHDVTCNLSRWSNGGNNIYKKRSMKTKTFWKNSFLKNKLYIRFRFLSLCIFISIQNIGRSIPLENKFLLSSVFFTIFCFFFLSTSNFLLSENQLYMPLLFLSHVFYSALIDWLIFKREQIWFACLNFTKHSPKFC